jgi:endonuclease/exonuclease/phosphatase family metal-dependent hydrolase
LVEIMSLNGWGGRLHEQLVAYVASERPDVLCLQEVVVTPGAISDWLDYRDLGYNLPQRANFFADVSAALPDHVAQFCPAAQGELWEGDKAIASQWGLATFVHKSLPIIGQAQGFVHGAFSAHGYGEHPRSRNAHVVRLYDYSARRPLTVAHTHGLRDLGGKQDTPARTAQAERLRALVAGVAEPGDAIVVCGDFNVEPDSETFAILSELGLVDLVTTRGFTDTRTSHYAKPGRFADYLLVNEPLRDAEFEVVAAPEVSDHRPLRLRIGSAVSPSPLASPARCVRAS